MANKTNTVETKSALEILMERKDEAARIAKEQAEFHAKNKSLLESVLKEKADLEAKLRIIDETLKSLGLVKSGAGRPKMTEEEKAAAKATRDAKKATPEQIAEKANVLTVLKGEAQPAPAPVAIAA